MFKIEQTMSDKEKRAYAMHVINGCLYIWGILHCDLDDSNPEHAQYGRAEQHYIGGADGRQYPCVKRGERTFSVEPYTGMEFEFRNTPDDARALITLSKTTALRRVMDKNTQEIKDLINNWQPPAVKE